MRNFGQNNPADRRYCAYSTARGVPSKDFSSCMADSVSAVTKITKNAGRHHVCGAATAQPSQKIKYDV